MRDTIGDEETWKYSARILRSARTVKYLGLGYPALIGGMLVSLLVVLISVYLAQNAVKPTSAQTRMRRWLVAGLNKIGIKLVAEDSKLILWAAVACLSRFGTSFEEADLKDANFGGVDFRNTNFKGADNAGSCYFGGCKDIQFANALAERILTDRAEKTNAAGTQPKREEM